MGTVTPIRPKGQEVATRRALPLALTEDERRHLQAALKNLRAAFGTWSCLAAAMGVNLTTLQNGAFKRGKGSALLAWRAAQASGIPVEQILTGKLVEAGACPLCRRKPERKVVGS
jgi:hypothetical protein